MLHNVRKGIMLMGLVFVIDAMACVRLVQVNINV